MTALLYIQGDGTLLVQSGHPHYDDARYTLLSFAEMVQRVDPIHVYQVRPVTLWQAASLGVSARDILTFLRRFAAHPIPYPLQQQIVQETSKWGSLTLHKAGGNRLVLRGDAALLQVIARLPALQSLTIEGRPDGLTYHMRHRAEVKRILCSAGYPVIDRAGYRVAPSIEFSLLPTTQLRDYQTDAVDRFFSQTQEESGIVVLPCGAGKTLVGIGILARLQMHALILAPSDAAVEQWRRECLARTTLTEGQIRKYEPGVPLAPITVSTYQRVTARTRTGDRVHLRALTQYPWGMVVYDEVHMLPAPLFRLAADLQSTRRLGLTATLVREDDAVTDVFSLIGAKCYEIPWRQLERRGYLASVRCVEVRVGLDAAQTATYSTSTPREQHRVAALNEHKLQVVQAILEAHRGESVLVIGHYLSSLHQVAALLDCPVLTGQTPSMERLVLLDAFRDGQIKVLALSRVANMAVDLPCASVAVQLSGLFGSRQEEAQRLGRLLRPDTAQAVFYTLVSRGTVEERLAKHRQMYLVEQGYAYDSIDAEQMLPEERVNSCEAVGMPEYC